MLNPLGIIGHDLLTTKLTSFPSFASLESTKSLANMLIDFIDVEHQATPFALLVMGLITAFVKQVFDDLSNVDTAHTLFTVGNNFAFGHEMSSLVEAV
jgi:hypothetical protein